VNRHVVCPLLALAMTFVPTRPVLAQARASRPADTLVVARRVEHLDVLATEPMVAEAPDGTLFVAGYERPSISSDSESRKLQHDDSYWAKTIADMRDRLWRSRDHGATWSRVDLGPLARDVVGNSDVDLAVAADGTLYFATMLFDDLAGEAGEGRRISIGVSHDAGATWTWTVLSSHRFDDRPWVEVAPDGTAHVIWNDDHGVNHAVSRDGGASWTKGTRVSDSGGSSHLAVGPAGEVAVRVVPHAASGNRFAPGVDLIAISTDGGQTWQKHAAPGRRDWLPGPISWKMVVPRWVEPLTWDGMGRLYSLWTDTIGVWLARSADRGATWTTWRVVESAEPCYFPYLVARGDGELAATWRSGKQSASVLHLARIQVGHGAARPRVVRARPIPMLRTPRGLDAQGEYLAVTFLRDGAIGLAIPTAALTRDGWWARGGFAWWRFESQPRYDVGQPDSERGRGITP